MDYLREADAELTALGLPEALNTYSAPSMLRHSDLNVLVDRTKRFDFGHQIKNPEDVPEMKTAIGQKAVSVLSFPTFTPFGVEYRLGCCDTAEYKLVAGIELSSVANDQYVSPTIVTQMFEDEEIAVALIKGYGEKTLYGLRDVPERQIFSGVFSSVAGFTNQRDRVPRTDSPQKIGLDELGGIWPVRFSSLIIPVSNRAPDSWNAHEPNEQLVLETSHDDIVNQVRRLLDSAEPLPPSTDQTPELVII